MKTLMTALLLLSTHALAGFNFQQDGLCFVNGTQELRRFGPLGKLGDKEGVCQGMSGIVAAFHEQAEFVPHAEKLTARKARAAVSSLLHYHSGGCKSQKIQIKGYRNLQEFCHDHKDLLLGTAIAYNADIAIREISWNLTDFLYMQDDHIRGEFRRKELHAMVKSLRKSYNKGRWPLMLYWRHVVMIHGINDIYENGKLVRVRFALYDSNFSRSISYDVEYNPQDGLPAAGQPMIWDVTPSRLTTVCW